MIKQICYFYLTCVTVISFALCLFVQESEVV